MTKNILIAEDDEDIVGLLRLYLEKDGYKVISVDNGEDAFKIVKNSQISLALLDIMMPLLNGMETAHEIRKNDSVVKIIFLTSSPEFALESYDVKASGYL